MLRLSGWSDPAVGLLPAQMVMEQRAASSALLSHWLQAALSPSGREIRATHKVCCFSLDWRENIRQALTSPALGLQKNYAVAD